MVELAGLLEFFLGNAFVFVLLADYGTISASQSWEFGADNGYRWMVPNLYRNIATFLRSRSSLCTSSIDDDKCDFGSAACSRTANASVCCQLR